jgi:hypothetical protein
VLARAVLAATVGAVAAVGAAVYKYAKDLK